MGRPNGCKKLYNSLIAGEGALENKKATQGAADSWTPLSTFKNKQKVCLWIDTAALELVCQKTLGSK